MKNNILITLLLGVLVVSTVNGQQTTSPSTYALVVGISDYQDEDIPDLRFADKDAEAFAAFLQSPAGGALDEDHLKVLINEQATVAQFAIALDWLWEVAKENDQVIIYFSGHGDVERKSLTQPGFLLCWDAPARVYLAGGTLALPMFQEVISTLSVQNKAKVTVITDACRSGKLSGSSVGGSQLTSSNLARQYANEIKILSCQPNEYSIEGEQWGGGRGAFSYHLLDGLTGMADDNEDYIVNLKEIGRYLEDKVTTEVAPEKQNPMVVGSKEEKLTDVFPEILDQLREGKKGQLQLFTATDSRGIEDDVLAAADSNIVAMYRAFQESLANKNFLCDANGICADNYYAVLSKESQLEKLHSSMRRNYAAALQDDAQQVLNERLKSDDSEFSLSDYTRRKKYKPYIHYIERASELLGKQHYMYDILQARKLYFDGYLLSLTKKNLDQELGRKALAKLSVAIRLQPEFPHAYLAMGEVYANNLQQLDSARYYAELAVEQVPSWVMPYISMSYIHARFRKFDYAEDYLKKASLLEPNSAFVADRWGNFYFRTGKMEEAEKWYEKAIQLDSTSMRSHFNLGWIYYLKDHYVEAEKFYKKAVQLDSTFVQAYYAFGNLYYVSKQYELAEKHYKKAIQLDSNFVSAYYYLGDTYLFMKRYELAEKQYKKAIQLDSTNIDIYNGLGLLYLYKGEVKKAEEEFLNILKRDSSNFQAYYNLACLESLEENVEEGYSYLDMALEKGYHSYLWMQNDVDLVNLRNQKERWHALMKKHFPDQTGK